MTDIAHADARTPLGVGRIVGDTFSILFRKLPAILLLAFVPSLIAIVLQNAFVEQAAPLINARGEMDVGRFIAVFLVLILLGLGTASVITAAIVQLSYDARLNRPARMGRYIIAAIRNLPAVLVLTIAATLLYSLGFMALVVPGLWLLAVFSVFVPAIVIEGEGFRALGRSALLTKGYRWPIVGTLFLVYVCLILVTFVVGVVAVFAASAIPAGASYVKVFLDAVGSALGYGMISITVALIFARLKEIKEGVSVSDLVDVFR